MDLTQKVRELALANHLDYVGIAPADLLENEPEGHRPSDFLPGAKSIVCLGIQLRLGVQLANKLAHHDHDMRHAIYPYLWHGFGFPSLHFLDRTALLITRLLEKEGYQAVPIMAASTFDIRTSLTEFSNIHAAVAAGLGELGWSGMVLTTDVGPRARFGTVITNAELEPDPMYHGKQLCHPDKCKEDSSDLPVCARVCPTGAISLDVDEVTLGDKTYKVARIDQWRCMWGSMGLSEDSLGLKRIPLPDKIDVDAVFKALKERDPAQSMELMVIGRGDYCGKCIMECPVGRPQKVEELLKLKRSQKG